MLRRSHKKSRGGCLECYASQGPQISLTKSNEAPPQQPSDSLISDYRNHGPAPDVNDMDTSPPSADSPASLSKSTSSSHPDPILDEPVNFNHMELLAHLSLDSDMFNLGFTPSNVSPVNLVLKSSLESPCLMHLILAFSARHLAFLHPERSSFYLHQAVTLQTRAISMFNASWTGVTQSNCVWVLFFSSVLGHHMLTDTLARRDPGGIDVFMTHYIQFAAMHKGIYTVASTAWPALMDSELAPILALSEGYHKRSPRGSHCQQLKTLVDGAIWLGEEEKEACRLAINYLQIGFDSILSDHGLGNRYHIIFIWALLLPQEFTTMLAAKQPEALELVANW
ncbi:hypothetical protein UA08_07104 [Talaromyces atroroseus]|uniref:Uncharacterized protein n=1 Tax=Talaromyces atroroseus TaxID=1441469 RepID=A0A225ABQ4_TALAT|nr:hypothetical protein UA08_07104 [Talaromyces atroroseus]OKL57750.1 hypothetical protein UA08_07104 [Talaromyces atroroseus]